MTVSRALRVSFWLHLLFWLVWVTAVHTFGLISLYFAGEAYTLMAQAVRDGGFNTAAMDHAHTVSERGELSAWALVNPRMHRTPSLPLHVEVI